MQKVNLCREVLENAIGVHKNCEKCGMELPPLDVVAVQAMEELLKYRDAEEQGLILRLPCKEVYSSSGDTVYYIFDYETVECINCGVSMDYEGRLWIALACDEHIFPYRNPDPEHDLDPTDWCINTTQVPIEEWGKTVFLTQEEAEQALKQMENAR